MGDWGMLFILFKVLWVLRQTKNLPYLYIQKWVFQSSLKKNHNTF